MTMFGRPKAQPEPAPEPVKAPEAPPALTREDVATMLGTAMDGVADRLGEAVGGLREGIETLAARPITMAPADAVVAAPGITDDEIDSALLGGTGAAANIRRLVDKAVNDRADALVRDHIAPLQNTGLSSLAELNKKVTLGNMPHYARFRGEIDERLARLDPAVQTNTNALAMVYFAVVGEHTDELNKETEEATIRKIQEAAAGGGEGAQGAATPGGSTGVTKREEKPVPSALELTGSDGMVSLAHKGNGGQSQDEFAQSMGYNDWASYIKQGEELEAAETARNS